MRTTGVLLGLLLSWGSFCAAQADDRVVMQRSNIRASADIGSPLLDVARVGRMVKVVDPAVVNKYVKISLPSSNPDNPTTGWILAQNLEDLLTLGGRPTDDADALAGATNPGCNGQFADYSDCPKKGCGTTPTKNLFNTIKNKGPMTGQHKLLTFSDFHTLQDTVEALNYNPNEEMTKAKRNALLHDITLDDGSIVSEGDLVALSGFISIHRTIKCGSQESCNCTFKNGANDIPCSNTDIHLPIVERATLGETKSVVAELTPRITDLDSIRDGTSLKAIQDARQQVLVVGQLFFDNAHLPNPTGNVGTQPKRFTVWEVHPITEFYTCPSGQSCDPEDVGAGWTKLGS